MTTPQLLSVRQAEIVVDEFASLRDIVQTLSCSEQTRIYRSLWNVVRAAHKLSETLRTCTGLDDDSDAWR